MKALTKTAPRMEHVDIIRGLGMLSIVFVHTCLVLAYPKLTTYLQSFHLFLFFFVSGYLLKKERLTESLGRVTLRYVKYLLIPYAFFSAINWILNASMGATQEQLIRNLVMANLTFGAIWFL